MTPFHPGGFKPKGPEGLELVAPEPWAHGKRAPNPAHQAGCDRQAATDRVRQAGCSRQWAASRRQLTAGNGQQTDNQLTTNGQQTGSSQQVAFSQTRSADNRQPFIAKRPSSAVHHQQEITRRQSPEGNHQKDIVSRTLPAATRRPKGARSRGFLARLDASTPGGKRAEKASFATTYSRHQPAVRRTSRNKEHTKSKSKTHQHT